MLRIVMGLVMALWLSGGALARAPDGGATLTVLGEGVAQAVPDMATIRMGVSHQAQSAGAALEQTSIAAGEMLTLISELGIPAEDVQTSGLSLSPVWRRSSTGLDDEIAGYRADTSVTVRVRALPDLGAILDDLVASGANRFDGLALGLQDEQPVLDGARRAAVADARRKAMLYAEAAGVTLGPVLSISEPQAGRGGGPEMAVVGMAMGRSDMPIAAGTLELAAEIQVVYGISER